MFMVSLLEMLKWHKENYFPHICDCEMGNAWEEIFLETGIILGECMSIILNINNAIKRTYP